MRRIILLLLSLLIAGTVQAQSVTMLQATGFLYESDNAAGVVGFPPSDPGEVLTGCGYIVGIGPDIDWDPATHELTWVFSGLISNGALDIGGGYLMTIYAGGTIEIWADAYAAPGRSVPDYGVEPPNATSPATFADGELYLLGEFTSFYITYNASLHSGNFEGHILFTGGSQLNTDHADPVGYTVAGTVDPHSAPVPEGYDLEAVGEITFDPALRTEKSTWGQVKSLYH
jgi:hypothetical protein